MPQCIDGQKMKKNSGAALWKRAKAVIPGGNMLLSKRTEQFLPEFWPSYFSKAKSCYVWDLDGKKYTDICLMGVGTNILGYGNTAVDSAVRSVVDDGNMSTLNCPEEVYLAEKLVQLHPWSDMVKFARSGGEANAMSIRIARAASGKDNVAICGYHGWHDWYLAANLGNHENLDGHLLPGLETKGVPRNLSGSVFPFRYNDLAELEDLVKHKNIGVIKMEVSRTEGPRDNYLQEVRKIADRYGAVLIFDECTSGFRETFGGLHKKYGVEPDLATFGKAIGNGYALTAVIGRRSVMEHAQSSFISSTFWTERVGPAAALTTLEIMENTKSWEYITQTGEFIKRRWEDMFNAHGISANIGGLSALPSFSIPSENMLYYKTFISQEMMKVGYLASNVVYVCTKHNRDILEPYFEKLDMLLGIVAECEAGRNVIELLDGDVCQSGFKRLN